jgi:hypothetical protein
MWCIPPNANAEFVWKMEDVLEVYQRFFLRSSASRCDDVIGCSAEDEAGEKATS